MRISRAVYTCSITFMKILRLPDFAAGWRRVTLVLI
jgi:hypothetical protein